jgi:hypothetical protein
MSDHESDWREVERTLLELEGALADYVQRYGLTARAQEAFRMSSECRAMLRKSRPK